MTTGHQRPACILGEWQQPGKPREKPRGTQHLTLHRCGIHRALLWANSEQLSDQTLLLLIPQAQAKYYLCASKMHDWTRHCTFCSWETEAGGWVTSWLAQILHLQTHLPYSQREFTTPRMRFFCSRGPLCPWLRRCSMPFCITKNNWLYFGQWCKIKPFSCCLCNRTPYWREDSLLRKMQDLRSLSKAF